MANIKDFRVDKYYHGTWVDPNDEDEVLHWSLSDGTLSVDHELADGKRERCRLIPYAFLSDLVVLIETNS